MYITGTVVDLSDNSNVGGATVKIYYKPYQNGVFTTSYSYLTSTTTNSSGTYEFDIEKPNTSDFKFVVEKTNYFPIEKVVNPDNLSLEKDNTLNFETDPSATINIHLKNTSPFNSSDFVQFQLNGLNYSCSSCCTNAPLTKTGTTVDTSYTCLRYGGRYLKYQYIETKNGSTSLFNDSIYCGKGATVALDVFY